MSLAQFYGDGNSARVKALLEAMKAESRAVKPKDLGLIGKEHLLARFGEVGVASESFEYRWDEAKHNGSPYLIEVAFGYRPGANEGEGRILVTGINWSPAIGANPFRSPRYGESLDGVLANQFCDEDEPIAIFVHLTGPRIDYTDRGKSSVSLAHNVGCAIADLVEKVTTKWTKQRKAEDRHVAARQRRVEAMIKEDRPMSVRDAAFSIMERAYLEASAGESLPANPRQIFYKARPLVMALTDKQSLDSQYFCQTLLVDYIEENNLAWDIAWDDRGHFREPK
jgi:DNA topoisomerase VI subunit B